MPYQHGRTGTVRGIDGRTTVGGKRGRRWPLSAATLCCGASLLAVSQAAHAADPDATASTPVGEVVVSAPRQEIKARVVQHTAPNLISVLSAETMAKYPDFNAAEALGRVPGISISTDTGEGRFVNIRGIDGNLDGQTFGGVPMLNTEPGGTYFGGGGRAVEFDTIPIGSVDGIIVTYTGLPDHDAEGLGGSVELTPRSAADITKPFLEAAAGWGYEPEHAHTGPVNLDLALGARFGFDDGHMNVVGVDPALAPRVGFFSNPTPFSFVLDAGSRSDRRGFDDMEEDYNDAGSSDRSYQDLQFRRYDYHRDRLGYGGEFDFKPNDDHSYYVRANVAGYTESVQKNRLTLDFSNYAPTPDGTGYSSPADLSINTTDEQETHQNQVYVVGGVDRFDNVVLDYHAAYSRATYDQTKNYGTAFNGPTANVIYNNSANNGDFPTVAISGVNPNDASLYTLAGNTISNGQEHDVDEEYSYAANLLFPVHLINDEDRVKVGFEIRLRDKDQNVYDENIVVAPLNLATVSDGAITNFYAGRYTNGPTASTVDIRNIAAGGVSTGGFYGTSDTFDPTGYFSAKENIYAGYAQYQAKLGQLGILAGVRVEATQATYGNYVFDGNGALTGFMNTPHDYTNAFPTVQLRYDFTPRLVLRATYSTGIARPGFNQVAGATTVDQSNQIITTGNPKLQPTLGNNFDLDLEYYLPGGGIAQLGAFDKEFSNYVVTRSYFGNDPRIPTAGLNQVQFITYGNVSSAYARGIEGAYHQQFSWLPGVFKGLGVESNVTLVDSRIEEYDAATSGTGTAEYGLLPGTSRVTANLAGFYEAYGLKVRLSGEYVSPELFSLGGSKAQDTIQDKRLTVDFGSSYDFNSHWQVYFNAKNLTNEPLRFYMGSPSFPIQREFYDVTYEAGIKARF